MTIYLTYSEINSLASLSAIALRPGAGDAAVLEHVRVEIQGLEVTAYATDRHVAGRIRFDLTHAPDPEVGGDEPLVFTASADVLRRAAAAAKRATGSRTDAPLVELSVGPLEGVVDINVSDGADVLRSHPPRLPGADRISTFPPVGRLFPGSDEHVNDIVAGEPVNANLIAAAAKLRHPADILTGRGKTEFGSVRISLAHSGKRPGQSAWFISRRAGNVAVLVQPLNANAGAAAIEAGTL